MKLAALLLASAAFAFAAEPASVAGKWKLHSSIAGYEVDLECTLTQEGSTLAGACKGEQGNLPVTGKVEDSAITIQHKVDYNGDQLTVIYNGKLTSPEKLSGSVRVEPMGVDGEFSASLVK